MDFNRFYHGLGSGRRIFIKVGALEASRQVTLKWSPKCELYLGFEWWNPNFSGKKISMTHSKRLEQTTRLMWLLWLLVAILTTTWSFQVIKYDLFFDNSFGQLKMRYTKSNKLPWLYPYKWLACPVLTKVNH